VFTGKKFGQQLFGKLKEFLFTANLWKMQLNEFNSHICQFLTVVTFSKSEVKNKLSSA
jgi:hypothetical protein